MYDVPRSPRSHRPDMKIKGAEHAQDHEQVWLAAGVVAVAVSPGVAFAASSITGTITFEGKAPDLKPLAMDADPACAKKHSKPVPSEMLVLGSGNTMGNILVFVSKGVPAGKTYPGAQDSRDARSAGLSVRPARPGDHGRPAVPDPQLRRRPPQRPRAPEGQPGVQQADAADAEGDDDNLHQARADLPDQVRRASLDEAWIGVFTHPFFSATGTDGKFTISGLDPGTYEITAWHERLGTQTATVTVAANETKTQNFKFVSPRQVAVRREAA